MQTNSNESIFSITLEFFVVLVFFATVLLIVILLVKSEIKKNSVECVKKDNVPINKSDSNESKTSETNKNNKKSNIIGKTFLIVCLITVIFFGAVKFGKFLLIRDITAQNRQTSSITTRNSTNNDVYIEINENLSSFCIDYKVKPNVDIENLQITCEFYNSSGSLVKTQVKNLGNVKKGVQFSFSVSFSISEALKINQTITSVTGGTVSIFAS